MKVLLRAPLLTNSGYGVHSRQIFKWLYGKKNIDLTVQCLRWGRCSWIINPKSHDNLIEKIMKCSNESDSNIPYDVSFQVQLPNEWDKSLGKINVGISAFVETDKCNPKWIEACNNMDHIVVPSTFTKNVAKRSGNIKTPIFVIPEWFNQFIINNSVCNKITNNDDRYNFDTKFNIMVMGLLTSLDSLGDRKNLVNTIKWLIETFEGNKDVGIVLKTNVGKSSFDDKNKCTAIIGEIIKKFRKSDFPKIHFIHGNMSPKEIAGLYNLNNIKLFASATRGEGYGLPLIDAAASGIPIIATGWSGHFEFLDKDLMNAVDYNLVQVPNSRVDNEIFLNGFRWAEPSKNDFCRKLKLIYDDYSTAKQKAKTMQKKIIKNYNQQNIKNLYDDFFNRVVLS